MIFLVNLIWIIPELNASFLLCSDAAKKDSCFELLHTRAHHGGLVVAVEDVDKIRNGQHTCDKQDSLTGRPKLQLRSKRPLALPTNVCNLSSHKSAALRPFATSAKKAFFTCGSHKSHRLIYERGGGSRKEWISGAPLTWSWVSKMTSLQLTGMAS